MLSDLRLRSMLKGFLQGLTILHLRHSEVLTMVAVGMQIVSLKLAEAKGAISTAGK